MPEAGKSYLSDTRVIELADEQGEYCGRVLAGLGADVIKVEPPGGSTTRAIGPFYEDVPGPDRSLYFWQYNLAKRSVTLDLETEAGREGLFGLLAKAEVFVESTQRGYLDRLGLGKDALLARFPSLIVARVSPFGDEGPWAGYRGSDLVHLALGGPTKDTGYDPEPDGHYETPPIAGQMWHAYHVTGEQLAIAIMGARLHQRQTGEGQYLSAAVHDAVVKNVEGSVTTYLYQKQDQLRQVGRHARPTITARYIWPTKDGRYFHSFLFPWGGKRDWLRLVDFLDSLGMAGDLRDEKYLPGPKTSLGQSGSETDQHITEVIARVFARFGYENVPWMAAQEAGLMWVPVRKPHENVDDPHWQARKTFAEVHHPEHGRSFTYPIAKWLSAEAPWVAGPRAPLTGEHTSEVLDAVRAEGPRPAPVGGPPDARRSRWGKPFALHGVRILDFTQLRASGGGPRFLSALGAENLKVEWKGRPDMRGGPPPVGVTAEPGSINVSGGFHDMHSGHHSISLNMRDPKAQAIARRLVAISDIVAEGFSPGVLESWGIGYEAMKQIKPDIIYVSQSGMGTKGTYGKFRSVGPIAQSLAGTTEMAGLPDPYPPSGWGYSYLDWFGAYNIATAMIAALNYRAITGKGMWIDSSQVESGICITGTAVLEHSANGRAWQRYGNRSPYKPAAPHGIYRCRGTDRWIAIACFSDADWMGLVSVAGNPDWAADARFATLESRLANQDALDAAITSWTVEQDDYALMDALQAAGVAAGVSQAARDIVERDPQLPALEWLTYTTGKEIGTQPVKEFPVKMSATPPFMGGAIDRGHPCYGEDNAYVYGELLGMSSQEMADLEAADVI